MVALLKTPVPEVVHKTELKFVAEPDNVIFCWVLQMVSSVPAFTCEGFWLTTTKS